MSICAIETSSPQDHISGLIAGFRLDEEQNGLIAAGLVFDGARPQRRRPGAVLPYRRRRMARAVEVIVPYARRVTEIAFDEPKSRKCSPRSSPNVM